ncbi:SURF1 family protein [bacterium]|nr:SURF1 family protein [bacterium]
MTLSPRFFLPAVLTLVMLVTLLGLGTWQVQRLAWKLGQIDKITARQNSPIQELNTAQDIAALREPLQHYQKTRLRGTFGPQQVFWYTQIHNPPAGLSPQYRRGFHVLSPFYLTDGSAIMIDRGFVPVALKDALANPPEGEQTLAVVLRWPDQRGVFDAEDAPFDDLFYVRDPKVIGQHWGVALPPVIGELAIDDSPEATPWPRGGQTRLVLNNRHLQYAVTWYGLAVVLVFISGLWHIRAWKAHKLQEKLRK